MFYLDLLYRFIIRMFEVWGLPALSVFILLASITFITGDKSWLRKILNKLDYIFEE